MKKVILSLLSCLFMSLCFAQNDNVLTDELQKILNQRSNELIDINIYFKSQMPTEHLQSLNVKSDSKEVRREIVINELKKFSQQQQESVMSVINAETRSNNVTDVKSHWLVNSINCKASRDVIYTLASHPDIKHIDYNKEEKMFEGEDQDLREQGTGSRGSVSSVTDNITHVQAEKVWDLGYTGKGVIVAVIDSGINTDHVDLEDHLWYDEGAQYPGYNFVFPGQNPTDDNGHGTHCSGTVCGDGTSGLTTGMAPDATLMPLKVTNRSTGIGADIDRLVESVEYAVEKGADIISISIGGWTKNNTARQTLRAAFDGALAAGVITSAAAGNNREYLTADGDNKLPVPININAPSDCPPPWIHPDQQSNGTTVSGVVSVGAVDENNVIANISSQGPVTWSNTTYGDYPYDPEIGLIRPDIVAPGASVKSLAYDSNTGYAIKAGTSMAAPCVAGVMALMLEKNPALTPADLCRIIETTATKLTPTKSNDYGSGCINALAAVQAVNFDVAGAYLNQYSFTKNFEALTSNANQNLELTLINNGTQATASTTNVTLTSNDEYVTVVNGNASINNSIAVGGTATCNFTIKINTLSPDNHIAELTVNAGTNNFNIEINISNEFVAPSTVITEVQNLRNVYLSWNATNNATGYKIYRDGAYVGETSTTSYTDENLDYGTLYTYTITTKRGELETEHSREIRVQTGDNPEVPSPTNVVATDNNSSVAISWNNSTGSKGSNIYRKDNMAGTETKIASNVSGSSYTDNISLQDGIYQYGVANLHSEKETIYEEGFENNGTSLPIGWSVYGDGASQYNWGVKASQTTNNTTFTSYTGNYAAFNFYGAMNYTIKYYLVTSSFDLSEYQGSDVTLSFYYITPAWGTDVNDLNVRIGSSPTGPWDDAIWTSNETDETEWTKAEVDITSYIGSTFYITFENEIGYGLCSAVDDVSIAIDGNKESRIEWSDAIHKNVNVINKDGDWNNTDNWATNNLPTENDNHITIDANVVINSEVTVNSLTINEGKSITLNRGAKLIVNGEFNNSDPTALIINDGAQVVHNSENLPATFNMNIVSPTEWSSDNKTGWQFIASPIKNAKINDFIPESSDYDLYRYDGTKDLEWINHKDENDYEEPIIDTVTIGEGTISKIAAPICNAGGTIIYSLSQQIYTNEEIGCDGGTIKSVAFHQAAGNNNMRDIVVYLQNVDKASYNGNYDWITFSDADIVYQGTFDFGKVGEWVTIELQNAFAYTGNNLVITVYDKTGTGFGYDKCDKFYYSQIDEWRGMYATSSTEMNLSSLSSSYGTEMKTSNYETPQNVYYLNNIKLGIACIGSNETTAPDAPQNLVANAISSSAISLSWNSVKKATSYNIYEGEETVATNITETTYTVDGLTAETEYCFTVTAVNEVGESEKSEEACATTKKDIPAAPIVTATAISSTQIQLSWETVAGATWYNVYSSGHNFGPTIETSLIMGYLEVNTYHCFDVSAANEAGESAKTIVCATTLNAKPITPYDFTATATGESTIELSWSPAPRATSYNVYQGDEKIATVTEATHTVEGLEPETNYCFTVTAENEVGESDKTEEKCATTEEKAPTIVEIGTESEGSDLYLPVYDYSAYSISQQIYTSTEIALGNGTIRSVSFKVGDKGNAATRRYEVYLKNITASSFQETGYAYFELSSSDKVYDGDVAVGGKQEWFTINFTTPFEYTGGNVVLCVYDKTGTALSNGYYHNFYKYATEGIRSLYNYDNNTTYNPTTLATSASGLKTSTDYVNLIRFGIVPSEVVVPVAPTLSATATSSSEISLTWNLVPGATSYNVYKDDEQIATGLTETTLNVEDLDAGTEYCFTVTAVNTAGESDESEGACAITDINTLIVDIDEINGQNAISSGNYYFPVYDFSPYALSQQIYTAEEIGFDEGTIYQVSFKVGTYGGVVDRQYEVYMKNINEDTFTSNKYLDLSSSDKVFDGEVKLATTNNWYDIKFTTPFNYTGGNVLLCVYDKTGTGSSPYHSFYQITASNRSLYSHGDYAYDPTNLTTGTPLSYVSQVRFEMTGAFTKVPNAPELTAEANSSSSISLTWDAVAKATSYNVYQSSTQIASNITETTYTVEGLETGEEYCFTVTAVNEVGESEHSEEACAVPAIVPEIVSVEIGANATYSSSWVPFCDYYENYISQQIYTKDEIGCVGTINSVSFKVSSGSAATRNLEVYMKNINQDAFSGTDFIALSASDKVFDGNVTVGTAGTWLSIPFSTPFDYTGNNVVVCVHDKTGSGLSPYHNFYSTYTTGKSLYSSTNPISLTTGKTTSYRSQIKFEIEVTPKVPDAPVLAAETNSSSSISLTWDDVANATSYNVYQGSTLITSGLTETSYTVEGLETGEEYCFTVTAVNEVGESEASNEKCVTAGEEQLVATILGTGEPGKAADIPVYAYYKYSVSQQIYLANEMQGNVGNITSITFFNVTGTQVNTRNIDVYMVHTTNSYFTTTSSHTNFVSMAESDKVYSGTYTFDASTQYSTIELTTPFAYNGQDNIILTVVDNTGTAVANPGLANAFTTFNSGAYRTIAHKQDSWGAYNITTLTANDGTDFSGNGAPRSAVNQIQFTFGSSSKSATREVSSVSPTRGFNESTFTQGVGYLASYENENTAVFKGNLNHEKYYEFPVSYNSEKDLANFHLLGNPFSFNMKWDNVTATNLASGYAVVNEEGGYTYLGAADDEIAVGDGFFVKAIDENPSISYNEGRSHRKVEDQSINVVITGNAGSDNVVVNLGKAGEEGFPKLKNFNEEITTIFVYNNDKSYGIYNCEEDVEEVPIYFNNTKGIGKYTISIDAKGDFENITLVDLVSGDETNMLVHDYNFTASQQENTKRFILKFVEKQQTTDNSNFVYQSGEELIVNTQGTVQIIDVVGRVVYNNVVLNESERINISGFTTGTYIVRVISESEVMTQKIVVY